MNSLGVDIFNLWMSQDVVIPDISSDFGTMWCYIGIAHSSPLEQRHYLNQVCTKFGTSALLLALKVGLSQGTYMQQET